MRRYARQLNVVFDIDTCRRLIVRSLHQIWNGVIDESQLEAATLNKSRVETVRPPLDRRWTSQSSTSAATVLKTESIGGETVEGQVKETVSNVKGRSEADVVDGKGQIAESQPTNREETSATPDSSGEAGGIGETNADRVALAYDLPRDWYSQTISPSHRRDRLVIHLSEWAKRRIVTPKLLLKLLQGPLCPHELSKYTSNNISRIVYAIGLIKKTDRLVGNPAMIEAFLKHLWHEATDRKRMITYDGIALSQTAFGFSMMKLDDPSLFAPFAEEGIKPHRIRNTLGKSLVNLLDSLYHGGYGNVEHVEIISRAAVEHVKVLPTFALPRLVNAWGHFKYNNAVHIRAVLTEALTESRLTALLAIHVEEILSACAKMQFTETPFVMAFVRELIYSQKWKFMTHGSLPRIVWALGTLQYEHPGHWKQLLSATLSKEVLLSLESNLIVDIYIGWSMVTYRDSRMLDRLGAEAIKNRRLEVYSTRQLFEIFKAQRLLGQFEKKYTKKIIERLQDTEKLMKCNLETKIQIVLYSNIKAMLGMENVEALMKAICQQVCLEQLEDRILIQLTYKQATLGTPFGNCFGVIVKEATKVERLERIDTQFLCRLLGAWHRLRHVDDEALERMITECSVIERLQSTSAEELLTWIWTIRQLNKEMKMQPLLKEAMRRPVSTFTAKGIAMLLSAVSEQDLDKNEIQPFVEELIEDAALTEASTSTKTELVEALKSIGFDNEASHLEQSTTSKDQTVDSQRSMAD